MNFNPDAQPATTRHVLEVEKTLNDNTGEQA